MEAYRIRKHGRSLLLLALLIPLVAACSSTISGTPVAIPNAPKAALNLSIPRVQIDLCAALKKAGAEVSTVSQAADSCEGDVKVASGARSEIEFYFFRSLEDDQKGELKNVDGYLTLIRKGEGEASHLCAFDIPIVGGGYLGVIVGSRGQNPGDCTQFAPLVGKVFSLLEKETPSFPENAVLLRLETCKAVSEQAVSQAAGQSLSKTTPTHGDHNCRWEFPNKTKAELEISYGSLEPGDTTIQIEGVTIENIAGKTAAVSPDTKSRCIVRWTQRKGPQGAEIARLVVTSAGAGDHTTICRPLAAAIIPTLPN